MDDLELRAPHRGEAAAIADLLNEHSTALTGRPDVTVDEIEHWFDQPRLALDRDMRIAVQDGVVIGYADLGGGEEDAAPVWIDLRITAGRGVQGRLLLEDMERNAARRGAPPRELRAPVHADDQVACRLLEERGFRSLRSGYRMEVQLSEQPPSPAWPEGIVLRPVAAGEERLAYDAYDDAFGGSPDFHGVSYEEWFFWLFDDEPAGYAFVAEDQGDVAGVSILRDRRGGDLDLGWIHVIGVRPPWRRRGLGRALLDHAFGELYARGKPRAGLGVDGANEAAICLYESAGMNVVRRNVVYGKQP